MNRMKRLAALLLAAIMVIALLPVTAMAEGEEDAVCLGEEICVGGVHTVDCPLYQPTGEGGGDDPSEPSEPTQPEETTAPTEPEETTAPTEPEETTAPSEPTEHTHAYSVWDWSAENGYFRTCECGEMEASETEPYDFGQLMADVNEDSDLRALVLAGVPGVLTQAAADHWLLSLTPDTGDVENGSAKVAKIGETPYATLEAAIEAANEGATIEVLAGTHTLPSSIAGKNITFKGSTGAILDIPTAVTASGSSLTFEGLTLQFDNDAYEGFHHAASEVYTNCTIKGTMFLYAPTASFSGCTFEMANAATEYSVWTYGSKNVTFTNCTFNTNGKAVLVYNEGAMTATIKASSCTFTSNGTFTDKAAIEVGESAYGNKATYTLEIDSCTATGFTANNTTSALWGNKNDMDYDHLKVYINSTDVRKTPVADNSAVGTAANGDGVVSITPSEETASATTVSSNILADIKKLNDFGTESNETKTEVQLSISVPTAGATVTFDAAATSNIAEAAASTDVTLMVKSTNVPDGSGATAAYDLTLMAGETPVAFNDASGGEVTVTLPLPESLKSAKGVVVSYYKDGVKRNETFKTTVSGGFFSFTTSHFSTYTAENAIAKIGDIYYGSLQAAIDAATAGQTITLLADVALTDGLEIAADDNIILDLNGKTISYASNETTGNAAITNKGTLTIQDSAGNGKITYSSSNPDTNFGYATNTITNYGALTVNGGTIENNTASGASYAIDNNSTIGNATVTISGGTIKANTRAIRQYANSATMENNVTITNGTVTGPYAVFVQLPGSDNNSAPKASLNVTGGALTSTGTDKIAIYSYSSGSAYNGVDIAISGGTISGDVAVGGGSKNNGTGAEKVTISGGSITNVYTYNSKIADKIEVSGGTFSEPVDQEYCKNGFTPIQNADGTYGVDELPEGVTDPEQAKINKTVTIKWGDDSNAIHRRPSSVVVSLYADGTLVKEYTVKASDGWKFTINDQPAYSTASTIDTETTPLPKKIAYTLKHSAVSGYTSSSEDDGFTIFYTLKPYTVYTYSSDKLLQTGAETQPIGLLALAGFGVLAAGMWLLMRKKEAYER